MNPKKTVILLLLAFRALARLFASLLYRLSRKILNTRNNLNTRIISKYFVPVKIKLKYVGIVLSKSIMPQKLKMYFLGFCTQINTQKIFDTEYDGEKPFEVIQYL